MKKFFITTVLLSLAISSFAQEKDITKFLGIPIDGTKAEMIAKLKEKGFSKVDFDEDVFLEGEFNGTDVYVFIVTNNRKVYRIVVSDKNKRSETDIKIRYNKLCQQFSENNKYISLEDNTLPEDEDISYQITVNNKRYQAGFYQIDKELFAKILLDKYSVEQLTNIETLNLEDQINVLDTIQKHCAHKLVWFLISESYGEYGITMYYDNVLNQANGDDL